ncbi:MAG: CBS domain-containing protein, partial [Planctomycetota bacterium]
VHSRLPLPEMIILFFGMLFLLSAGDDWLRSSIGVAFNPMVVCLAMGAVFANFALDPRAFEQTLATVSVPVFALFFVLAGYNLHVEGLKHLGVLGIAYVVLRSGGKVLGVRVAGHRLGSSAMISRNAGMALLCQAGVAIGLGTFLVNNWLDGSGNPHWLAAKINTVILASVVLYELFGPLLVKAIAVRAGEVKLVSLLRPGALPGNTSGPAMVAWDRIRKIFGKLKKKPETEETLTARHLMRTNVRLLPVEADLDEVLHFVERSHLSDFPVTDSDGKYVGIVHFQAIRDMMYDPTFAHLVTAFDLAEHDAPTVIPDTPLDELLEIFHEHDLGSLPVVADRESNQLIGIVEQRDLLKTFHRDTAQDGAEE